ncbi:MAG: ABC transporter permease [Ilumatobacteraceae bacterium]
MFLALKEMRRAKLRFGLLSGAVGLLVFLILFQQALLGGLINQFVGALKNQSADVLVYSDRARQTIEASFIFPDQLAQVQQLPGVEQASPLGQGTFTVDAGGRQQSAVLFGFELGAPGGPTTVVEGELPDRDDEAVASEKDRADGYDIGDVVQVLPDGVKLTIVGLARDANFSVSPTLFVHYPAFESAQKTKNPDAPFVVPSAIAVRVAPGYSPQQVVDTINEKVADVEALTRQQAVDQAPGVSGVRSSFAIILLLFYLIVPLVTGLFFLIVTFQKAAALTLLRAIGASARTLVVSLLVQVLLVVSLGSLIAFGLYALSLQGVKNLGIHVEVMPAVVTCLVVLALALVTSLAAVRRVLRIDPLSATTGGGVQV